MYNPPYGQPGYADYDYGDYNEGVGLYPSKKLTVAQRVSKWFSGFKIPSSKVFSIRWKHDLQIQFYCCYILFHEINIDFEILLS